MSTFLQRWEYIKEDIKARRNCRVTWRHTAVPGTVAMELVHDDMPVPLATLWARHVHTNEIEILYIHTMPWMQRCGCADWMLSTMIEWWPEVTKIASPEGSDSGAPWMKSNGFKRRKKGKGDWIKRVYRRKAKR